MDTSNARVLPFPQQRSGHDPSLPASWPQLMQYTNLTQQDLTILHQHADLLASHAASIVDAFYAHLYTFPTLKTIIERHSSLATIKQKTQQYLLTLSQPSIDDAYIADRIRIGQTHVRVGLSQEWVMTSVAIYLDEIERVLSGLADPSFLPAIRRRLIFDTTLIVGEYVQLNRAENEQYRQTMGNVGDEIKASISQITEISANQAKAANASAEAQQTIATSMQTLTQNLDGIQQIAALIADLSAQSNLLGLNAAIEAAHAGQAGRGFSVVAEEIRKLADYSQESVKRIDGFLNDIQTEGQRVADQIQSAMAISEEQAAAAIEVSGMMNQLSEMSAQLKR